MSLFRKRQVQTLSEWLEIATRKLTYASKKRIRLEIEAHYVEAVEAHRENGLSEADAQTAALAELGNAKTAGKRFRKQHLTEREEKRLKEADEYGRSIGFLLLFYAIFLLATNGWVRQNLYHIRDPMPYFALQFILLIAIPTACFIIARRSKAGPSRHLLLMQASIDFVLSLFVCLGFRSANSSSVSVAANVFCCAIAFLPFLPHFLISLHTWVKLGRLQKISTHTLPPASS